MKLFIVSLLVATVLTGASYGLGLWFGWISSLNWLEIFSVWTSYSCTFLCVKQSRWNYPIGVVSVIALLALFFQQGLLGSAALQLYLLPTLVYGYFIWGKDSNTKPVEWVGFNKWWLVYIGVTAIAYIASYEIAIYLGATLAIVDIALLVLSILAQFLLDRKKIENWFIWIVVDILSVWTYFKAGLPLVALQMGLFGLNAVWGFLEWRRDMTIRHKNDDALAEYQAKKITAAEGYGALGF